MQIYSNGCAAVLATITALSPAQATERQRPQDFDLVGTLKTRPFSFPFFKFPTSHIKCPSNASSNPMPDGLPLPLAPAARFTDNSNPALLALNLPHCQHSLSNFLFQCSPWSLSLDRIEIPAVFYESTRQSISMSKQDSSFHPEVLICQARSIHAPYAFAFQSRFIALYSLYDKLSARRLVSKDTRISGWVVRRPWSRDLYACTPTPIITSHHDVAVTSAHCECTCTEG